MEKEYLESAPSGASTGSKNRELRDNNNSEYLGKSVNVAVKNVDKFNYSRYLDTKVITNQTQADHYLCQLDGITLKQNLGGNTTYISSFSIAQCRSKYIRKTSFSTFS